MELYTLLLTTFIAAALTDVATCLGCVPFFFVRQISTKSAGMFTALAAGMMAAASLVQLVGEGLDKSQQFMAWDVGIGVALGSLFFLAAARWVEHNDELDLLALRKKSGAASLLIVLAMTIHSLPEGIAIGVGYGSGQNEFGLAVALAIGIHNIPEGLAIALALRPRGVSTWACVGWALFSSIPQPLAAVPAAWAVWLFNPLLPGLMGFAAGAMLHLVVSELLPVGTSQSGKTATATAFVAGVVVMIVLGESVGIG
ncbi:MAG: dihydroorotate dehydrogenase [Phycisphaerae bacterium]|nr:MAG: dihydroorotate dehydrogenase [Phycisphaerae bacterium]